MDTKTGVVIARCQVAQLHDGHIALLRDVESKHRRLVVLLGVAKIPGTLTNPLDYQTRVQMLREHCPEAVFYPLLDMPGDNFGWSAQVDWALHTMFPTEEFVLYGGRDSFLTSYAGRWPTLEFTAVTGESGTEARAEIATTAIDNVSFRAGVIYASRNRFQPTHSVVDLAIIRHADTCNAADGCLPLVLMGRKASESQAGRYRFVGGFVDGTDKCLEHAASREGHEETGLSFSTPIYIGSQKIDDRRYRGTGQSVMTSMFYAMYVSGFPTADDDMAELRWVPLHDCDHLAIDVHRPLATMLCNYLAMAADKPDILHVGML